ncbi:MAG: hypothetical protein H0X04_00285 [Chthoniobacterales bacterium]|nr:hypothetical protein [Chthoniobacterales bacterium]
MLSLDGKLLSNAICMATMTPPYGPMWKFEDPGPHVMWILESAEHYAWLVSHYTSLCESYREVFKLPHDNWRFDVELKKYYSAFPRNPWSDPPQLVEDDCKHADCVTAYRAFYLKYHVTRSAYKKVRRPFWVDDYLSRSDSADQMDLTATIENADRILAAGDSTLKD